MASTIRIFMLKIHIGSECLTSQNKKEIVSGYLLKYYFMQHENVEVELLFPFPNDCTSHKNLRGTLLPYPWFGNESAVSKSKEPCISLRCSKGLGNKVTACRKRKGQPEN